METQLVELDWRLKCDKCGIRPQSDVNPAASHQRNPLNYRRDLGGIGGLKTNSIGNWMYRTKRTSAVSVRDMRMPTWPSLGGSP